MMTLLGQHDQKQDYVRGVQLIRFAAQTADENAPQGAYVSKLGICKWYCALPKFRSTACYKHENYHK